jgi:hypothetical protein
MNIGDRRKRRASEEITTNVYLFLPLLLHVFSSLLPLTGEKRTGVISCVMLLISIIFLLMAIPLFSSSITPILLIRITSIILLYAAALSYNVLYINTISSGLGLYSGLFNVSSLTLYMQIFLLIVGSLIMMV